MKKILSVFMALCTVLTTLCIPPAPAVAQSTEPLASAQIEEAITLPVEEEPITLETLTEDCKILQYVDEEAFEAAGHAFRLPYLEELDTYVFQNTDGTRSVYYLYENVKFYDEYGNIREKDNTLQRETKGFRITENEFDLLLPHAVTDGVELTYQGYDVKLIPATEGKLTATAPGTLQDNSVVYESFFGAGTSLVYTPLLSGVKEEIVLEEYLPNRTFSFLLYTDGLYVTESEGRYILTQTKTSAEAVLYLGDIVVYDAIGRPSLGNLTVETVKAGDVYTLTVSADEAFLADPATVYPVTIDPDLTISDTTNGSGAIEDTTLFSGTPNLNTGDWVYNTAGYVDETYGAGRILVRLPGLYNSERFQSLTADRILSATFYTTKSSSKTPDYVNLYRGTDTKWGENTATWNNAANQYATDGNLGTSSASSSVVAFNITSLVRAWRNNYLFPSTGFMLINQNETDVNKKFGIYSSEHSNTAKRPYVVLNYSGTIWLDESEISIAQGKKRTLIATTDPAGGTVRWSSSNEAVATVSAGVVTANAPGFATITARYVDGNGQPHTAECVVLVWLPSDTYTINNGSQNKLLQLPVNAYTEGSAVYGTNGVYSEQNRWTYFKINHLDNGVYSIRSMLDNSMGLKRVGNNIVCGSIGTSNEAVPDEAKWAFGTDSGGTYIYSYNGAHEESPEYTLICAPSFALIDDLFFQAYSCGNELQTWEITSVAADCEGVTIWKKTDELEIGDAYTFKAAVFSTNFHEHGANEISWSVRNGTGSATINSSTGELSATSAGSVTVTAMYKHSSNVMWVTDCTLDIYRKAIIIIPGIMGSQIFADGEITVPSTGGLDVENTFEDGTRLWDPAKSQLSLIDEKIRALAYNSEGIASYSTQVNTPTINRYNVGGGFQYGATDIYRQLYNTLYSHFNSEYDIVLFEYDWREDPYDVSLLLAEFIEEKHYKKIVFVSHSMGGLVSSYYLSLGNSYRKLVDKHISIGTPYLGSVEMPYMYVTGNIRDAFYENWVVSGAVVEVAYNFPSIYGLFPFEQKWSPYMTYRSGIETTTSCATFEETISVLETYMPNWNEEMASRVFENRARLFMSNGQHITSLVDSYYIVGIGEETTYATEGTIVTLLDLARFISFTLTKAATGDGTVSRYSATIGNTTDESKTYYKSGSPETNKTATHVGMITGEDEDLDEADTSTIEFIVAIVEESVDEYSSAELLSAFGITQ